MKFILSEVYYSEIQRMKYNLQVNEEWHYVRVKNGYLMCWVCFCYEAGDRVEEGICNLSPPVGVSSKPIPVWGWNFKIASIIEIKTMRHYVQDMNITNDNIVSIDSRVGRLTPSKDTIDRLNYLTRTALSEDFGNVAVSLEFVDGDSLEQKRFVHEWLVCLENWCGCIEVICTLIG